MQDDTRFNSMTSRERILAAINHQVVDRVPTDIWARSEVWDQLTRRYGSEANARKELHIDGIMDVRPSSSIFPR